MADYTVHHQVMPTWALVAAIVGLFCLPVFNLLFLLIRVDRVSGYVEVVVSHHQFSHRTTIPVTNPMVVQTVYNQMYYVEMLANQA